MNETTKNFLQAWNQWTQPDVKPIFFRLYYDQQGNPITYSMEELPFDYIELTAEQYHRSPPNVKVVDGKIVEIKPLVTYRKLVPSTTGVSCSLNDVCIIVDKEPNIKWNIKTYEQN